MHMKHNIKKKRNVQFPLESRKTDNLTRVHRDCTY